MRKLYIILSIATLLISGANAQQQAMFTQYMFNGLALNPAYAGIHEGLSASMLWREQWVGFEGAPSTQTFSIHSPIRYKPVSLGAMLIRDKIGVTEQFGAYFSYAYRIMTSEKTRLSFGLQGSVSNFNSNFEDATLGLDPSLLNSQVNETKPNAGVGLMYHSDRFYVGLSVPQLINQEFDKNNPDSDSFMLRHYFATAGVVFYLSRDVKLKPNLLVKAAHGSPLQLDLNVNMLLQEFLWVGLSYRSFDSFDALVQFQLTPLLQLGYAFDFATTTELRRVNSGSHEIMLNYRFKLNKDRTVTPRYF
jgi:type IX secretion system PorP/SprF family membrane protein